MSSLQETGNHNPSDPDYEEWRQVTAVNAHYIIKCMFLLIISACFKLFMYIVE
jgi:hypothetical protein